MSMNISGIVGTVAAAGVGTDQSVNGITPSNITTFSAFAAYVLLKTIPANPNRTFLGVQNQTSGTIVVFESNGTGGTPTAWLIASGGTQPAAGGDFTWLYGSGQVEIYGPSGGIVAARSYP